MAEQITLTNPEAGPSTTYYKLSRFVVDLDQSAITIVLKGERGEVVNKVYDSTTTPTGASLITALNTSNNSTTSLVKRIYNRLIADGIKSGTVIGTPS